MSSDTPQRRRNNSPGPADGAVPAEADDAVAAAAAAEYAVAAAGDVACFEVRVVEGRNDVIEKNGAVVEVEELVHMLLLRLVVVPMAASLLLANSIFAWRQCSRAKLRRMEFRSFGKWNCWTCKNGAATSLVAQQSRSRIVQAMRTRRNSSDADDREELLEMSPWKAAWLLVLGESFVCRSCMVPWYW